MPQNIVFKIKLCILTNKIVIGGIDGVLVIGEVCTLHSKKQRNYKIWKISSNPCVIGLQESEYALYKLGIYNICPPDLINEL